MMRVTSFRPVMAVLMAVTAGMVIAGNAAAFPITLVIQSDPPGLTPLPPVGMDGGVTDIPAGGAASLWVNPTAGWDWTANLYNLGSPGPNYADGGDPRCTPRVTVTNAQLDKGNTTWPAPNHFNWYRVHDPVGPMTLTVTFKATMYNLTLVKVSDPPGLTVPDFFMDGGVTQVHGFQGYSFWVNSDATKDTLPYTAFLSTADQYNLGATGWPPNSPNYADGGDPLCTPRVTVTNAALYKGNALWPVPSHFDWFNVYNATGPVTITATYKPKNIPVTYGPFITGPAVVYHEVTGHSIVVTPQARTGYTLSGVTATSATTVDNGNGTWTVSGVTDLAGTTVTANYTPNTYTVTFNSNGGGVPSPGSKSVTFASTYGPLATAARRGYTFAGWYTAAVGGTVVTSATAVTTAANHTLYAHWTVNTYTATFDAQGGAAPVPVSKVVTFDAAYGPLATISRTGYAFNGWFNAPTGGAEVTAATIVTTDADHTLYARWMPNPYTVTFDPQGGMAPAPGSKLVVFDAVYGGLATTSRTGYTFVGWFTAPTGGTEVTSTTLVTVPSDHTLYAQWTVITFAVGYAAAPVQGGSVTGPPAINHAGTPGDAITLSAVPNPGWAVTGVTATNGAVVPVSGNDYTLSGVTADTTVTAVFEDTAPPTAVCQDVTVNLSAPILAAAAIDGGSTDNVGVTSLLIDGAADKTFTCADLGANTVTLRVGDAAGNFDECTATVTVVDNISPVAACQNLAVNLSAPTLAASAFDNGSSDNCAITSMLVDGAASRTFTCADMPTKTVTLRVLDAAGNFDECTATVTVTDNVAPVAACKDITVNLSSPTIPASAVDDGSSDNCAITSRLINGAASRTFTCANLGANVVTLRVSDAAGNFSTCAATVTVVDDIAPVAVCRNVTVNLSTPTLAAASLNNGSTDNCGIASMLVDGAASRTFTCADLGANTVTLSILDAAGNTGSCQATVTVLDNIAPVAACQDATVYLSSPTLLPAAIDGGSSDNCAIASMLVNGAASLTFTPGDAGVQTVTLRVADSAGVTDECTAQVTVVNDLPAEGEGEPPVEGEGEPPVEGEGEPPVEGEGEPPAGLTVTAGETYLVRAEGDSATFAVLVSGAQGVLSYQWYRITPDKALTVIPDATDAAYTIDSVALADDGEYQCEVYDDVLDETAWSPVFVLVVITGIPAVGLFGLALAAGLTALAGAALSRKGR